MKKGIIYKDGRNEITCNENQVKINGVEIDEEEKLKGEEWKDVAARHRKNFLHKHLKRQYENTIILTGAGSSYKVGNGSKQGKLMSGLWEEAENKFSYDRIQKVCKIIKFKDLKEEGETTDIEKLLTHAQLYQYVHKDKKVDKFIKELKKMVKTCCTLKLPNDNWHQIFLKKLVSKKMKYTRPKIFTLNYDTLFEQAAEKNGYMIIDGFSFNYPRKFKGTNFDLDVVTRITNKNVLEDNFVSNVVHIYKPHGSIDWEQGNEDDVIKGEKGEALMIYPSSNKYESSYRQPFFEMMSRFQQETRAKNTLLIIIGYSFGDEHINAMIFEALNVNSSITVILVSPDACQKNRYEKLHTKVSQTGNVVLTGQTFEEFVQTYPGSKIYAQNEGGDYDG
ncbi:SIR2 family protein [Listeria sp. PSOL-1]|uniref:SIR2 family protein n=1 Tax=Listeria sp. PSOL-1 TaxID=1844999 RepID=UPI001E568C32|nr:SIR2 family protein [Listeria sp. PSOL-1]